MIEYKLIERVVREPVNVTCDKCGNSYLYDSVGEMEIQEFHHVRFTGGYGSVFGDGVLVEADICQNCLKEILGEWCRINNDPFNNQEFVPHDEHGYSDQGVDV
jgi:hypothetical protein